MLLNMYNIYVPKKCIIYKSKLHHPLRFIEMTLLPWDFYMAFGRVVHVLEFLGILLKNFLILLSLVANHTRESNAY